MAALAIVSAGLHRKAGPLLLVRSAWLAVVVETQEPVHAAEAKMAPARRMLPVEAEAAWGKLPTPEAEALDQLAALAAAEASQPEEYQAVALELTDLPVVVAVVAVVEALLEPEALLQVMERALRQPQIQVAAVVVGTATTPQTPVVLAAPVLSASGGLNKE